MDRPVRANEIHIDLHREDLRFGVAKSALRRDAGVCEAEVDPVEALDRAVNRRAQAFPSP